MTPAAPSLLPGQRFGLSSKSVFIGQLHDKGGNVIKLKQEYMVADQTDASELPTKFSAEDFQQIYKRNFEKSQVAVHRVLSLIYIFTNVIPQWTEGRWAGRKLVTLW